MGFNENQWDLMGFKGKKVNWNQWYGSLWCYDGDYQEGRCILQDFEP